MKKHLKKMGLLLGVSTLPFLTGCTQMQQTATGAGIGAAMGGVAGYCIDGGAGGALLGAGLGGLAGGVAGHATHKGDKN